MRLLVTGSRDHSNPGLICRVLDEALRDYDGPLIVVHGAARGADSTAMNWALRQKARGLPVDHDPFPVTGLEWGRLGPKAGHIRNERMVATSADLTVAFFEPGALNKGTANCCKQADKAGIEVRDYPEGAWTERPAPKRAMQQVTQDSLDLGLYDTTYPQETR